MPDFGVVAGDTNVTIYVRLRDSTTGLAKTGLVFNSAGAVASYVLPGAARAAITLATQTVTGAHSDGGFVEVDATNCKGLYRLDLPDAAVASGAYSLISIEFDGIIEETVIVPLSNTPQTGDAHSRLVVVESAIDSDQTSRTSAISDVHSRLVVVESSIDSDQTSRTSAISDVHSRIVVVESSIDSDQTSRATAISDVKSALTLVYSDTTAIESSSGPIVSGTADSGSTTTMVDAARTEADTDYWKGKLIKFTSGTVSGQCRLITGFTPATDTITFYPATTQAITTNTYDILPLAGVEPIYSDTTIIASDLLVIEAAIDSDQTSRTSAISDVHSRLVVIESSIDSDQTSRATAISDVKSQLVVVASDVVQVYSDTTIIYSDTTAIEAGGGSLTAAQDSKLTQVHSDLIIVGSDVVQVYSDTTIIYSDTTAIEAAGGSLTAAQSSQLAQVHSDVIVIDAAIDSDQVSRTAAISDVHSRLVVVESAIDSDQTSRTSAISDVHSRLVVVESSIDSDQTSRTAAISDVKSQLTVVASDVVQVYSDTTIIASDIAAMDILLLDTTVTTVNSQTSFDLAGGSTNNNAYKDMMVEFNDVTDSNQPSIRQVVTYTAVGNRITINAAADFTVAASDRVRIFAVPEQIARISSDTTAIETTVTTIASDLLVVEAAIDSDQTSRTASISDVHSRLVVVESSIDSDQTSRTAAISDVKSALTVAASDAALLEAAHTEPTGIPAANESPLDKLGYLFMALRNKVTVDSDSKDFYDDAGNVEWSKALSDDGTTYTEAEGA